MRRATKVIGGSVWTLVASAALTKLWLSMPDAFPQIPPSVAEWLVRSYGAADAEAVADLEILVGFAVFIPLVALCTYLAYVFLKHVRREP
jgi:hypothetical protein